ncbi:hypothetical protein ACLB2K_071138 [Fragaria x ananassa]
MYTEGGVEGRQYSANINILLVDDDITTLNIVSAMLKTWSYEVVTVPNPIDALSILRKGKCSFDLVVTDLHMPQMNGLELQKLVHDEFELPVIMMSADDKESVILKSLEGGSVYYIVKPVSREDIQMVWKCVLQSRKSRSSSVTLEEIMDVGASGQLLRAPGELEDLDCISINNDVKYKEDHKKGQSGKKKMRKRDRNMDDEEEDDGEHDRRLLARKKAKVVWSNALHNHFLLAIKHIGLDKAVPKRILEFMNVPGLTRENVASHLQKYRMFLKRVAEKARLSKCLSERIFRSSLAFGLPSTASFNHVQREQYAEYLKQQLQMNEMGLAPPLQNTLTTLGTAHLGSSSFQYPMNYNQQSAALNLASNAPQCHQLFGSGQSRLLMNNTLQQQRSMQLGNGMNMFSQANQGSGFGMQMMNNNDGSIGGYGSLMNNGGNGLMNGGTNWMETYLQQSQAKQLQKALNFTSNPFNFWNTPRVSSPSIDNLMSPMNNANRGPSFGGITSQPARGFDNIINGGYNGLAINNEVVNGITNGVRNVSLNGSNCNAPTLGNIGSNVSSSRFETSTANPIAPIFPRNIQQQQNASLLLSPNGLQPNQYGMSSTSGCGNNDFSFSSLTNNSTRNFNISLANDDDDMMVINNLVLQQLENCQPPSHQKQGGEEVPINLTSMLYQDKVPAPISTIDAQVQMNTNHAAYGLVQQTPNHVANSQVQLNPNPSGNGEVHQLNIANSFANDRVQLTPNPFVKGQDQQNSNLNPISQFELNPSPTPTVHSQLKLNSAVNDEAQLDPIRFLNILNSNPVADRQLDLNPTANQVENPNLSCSSASNSQLGELNPTANQSGNPDFFGLGSYHKEDNAADDEQSWSPEEQGYNQQMLNSEFTSMFQSDDYSSLLDQQFASQDGDDDFLNALIGFGDY